jgi:hypothetical protein
MSEFDNNLPVDYVLEKFYLHSGKPKRVGDKYNASCPICREGNSWLKKKRLYYYPESNSMFCHNCQNSWTALWWIKEVTGQSPSQIVNDAMKNYGFDMGTSGKFFKKLEANSQTFTIPDLPSDAINLFDSNVIDFYKSDPAVSNAIKYLKMRKLDTAINRPRAIYFSHKDKYHKDRIIIPFYDNSNKICFYQSRKINDNSDGPKYLSKINSDKSIFNLNNVNNDIGYCFVFEGPVDACFVKNGVAVAGITCTPKQESQIETLRAFYKIVWVLDNPYQDRNEDVTDKFIELVDKGETVFVWPAALAPYKDINDICIDKKINEFPYQILLKHAKSGIEAKTSYMQIN